MYAYAVGCALTTLKKQLVNWMVVGLGGGKFKPFILFMHDSSLSDNIV
jgi:hypothetical protein